MALTDWVDAAAPPTVADRFRDTLIARARKRKVIQKPSGAWVVVGNPKLGDSYPTYTILEGGERYHCTCQDHQGGEFRRVCSHILAVMLAKEEDGLDPFDSSGREDGSGEVEEVGVGEGAPDPSIPQQAAGTDVVGTDLTGHPDAQAPTHPLIPATTRSEDWGIPPLPEWVEELREHQVEAIIDCVEAFERGARLVFLDAPTGSGKTLIAECVRRLVNPTRPSIYTCSTKTLQDQFLADYPYAKVIKGRRNYPTELAQFRFPEVTADDCTDSGADDCNWCEMKADCPYQVAKARALAAPLAVLNTSYGLAAWNGPETFQDRELVVVDECDLLEGSVMGYAEVRVSRRRVERMGLGYPERKTVRESWVKWVEQAEPKVKEARDSHPPQSDDVRVNRERRSLERLVDRLATLRDELADEDVKWIYQDDDGAVVFRPVTVDQIAPEVLWQHGQRFLCMSASIISPQEMAESLGFEDQWELVQVPSTFPVENRQVHLLGVGAMVAKKYDETLPKMQRAITRIVQAHPDERVLVHTVSYKLARAISEHLFAHTDRPVVTYTDGGQREARLQQYRDTEGAVMVAPSMDRGVDLPGDACRVQIIAKVPYPFLGDEQVKARLYGTRGGELWYAVQTARTIVQMTGRAVRSKSDWATTYILDSSFKRFWRQWKRLFPSWWQQAYKTDGEARRRIGL